MKRTAKRTRSTASVRAAEGGAATGHGSAILGQYSQAGTSPAARTVTICVILFVLVVWVFLPTFSNGFVNLDDNVYIYENPHVLNGLSWENICWAFTNLEAGFWHPLTWLSILLDRQVFGLSAGGHHATSLLLHAANTILLFLAFQRMTGATGHCAFVACLFALHPLHVEPVAWAADRKDVLSTFFWMLTLWIYSRYAQSRTNPDPSPTRGRLSPSILYVLSLVCFFGSLMSKPMAVTLPFILLLVDWWPLRRLQIKTQDSRLKILRPLIIEKLPFLAAAFFTGLLTMRAEKGLGALPNATQFPITDRMANALLSCVRYLGQLLWPSKLAVFYPYPKAFAGWSIAGAALLLLLGSLFVWRASDRKPYLGFGWTWYLVTLLPVLGLIQVGGHSHADRYTYVPLIGLSVVIAWGAHDLSQRWRYRKVYLTAAAAIALGASCLLTSRQLGYWKDGETLFRHAILVTKDNDLAYNNLGTALARKGQLDEAVRYLEQATSLAPDYVAAQNNLGAALLRSGHVDKALVHLREAVRLAPEDPEAHFNLADALTAKGLGDAAIAEYSEALKLNPRLPDAHYNLGTVLGIQGRTDQAIAQFREALRLKPDYAEAHCGLGIALIQQDRVEEAITELKSALKLNPAYPEAHCNLGVALGKTGRLDDAAVHLREALRLNPNYTDAQNNLRAVQEMKATLPPRPPTPPKP